MPRFRDLHISTKFNLIMSVFLIVLLLATAFMTYHRQQTLILRVAVDDARSFARQIIETRDYMSSVVRGEPEKNYSLVPQVVATQVAKRITSGSKYYVRQVSLRYRNPENRPDDYETSQLQIFASKDGGETYRVIKVRGQEAFRYMLPMVAEKSCLECHGDYDSAPSFVKERFPRGHYSYGYKVGEVIGAVSVTIPMADLYRQIGINVALELLYRAVIFIIIILVLGALIRRTVINPVALVSATLSRVTRTGRFDERIPQKSNDELGQLVGAFNAMMEELEHKSLQQQESEERYRGMIEMAHSAIVTFMEDGKIIIANQEAERLFGLSRQELLGERMYGFLEDGTEMEKGVQKFLREGHGGGVGKTTFHRFRNRRGNSTSVEIALSVSRAANKTLFTAILREVSRA
ncbi:MAG: histidine kinase [Geobacter sp.]|nr:MAG: histidine kinase [Geobacter sp.]